jgi:hypothetical protein
MKCLCPTLAAAPTVYTAEMVTTVYSSDKIRQISEIYSSTAMCLCCCINYECAVEVSFETFHPSADIFVEVRSSHQFYRMIHSVLVTGLSAVEAVAGLSSNAHNRLYIVSGTEDIVHNGDIHSVLADLSSLYANVIQALPKKVLPDVFVNTPADVEGAKPVVSDNIKGVVVVSDKGSVTIPKQWLALLPQEEVITAYVSA